METFAFAIPVASYKSEPQWTRLDELLEATLRSVLNQTDPNFFVFIAGHEPPPVIERLSDPRIQFLSVPFDKPVEPQDMRSDKTRKRWFIATEYRKLGGGYYMYLDGDDLVHRDLVRYVRRDNNKVGYFIPTGYALDYNNRVIAPIPGAWRKPFNHVCGSSGIVFFEPDDLPELPYPHKEQRDFPYFTFRNHLSFDTVDWKGSKLASIDFPAAVYTVNNGINVSNVLVRTEERQEQLIAGILKHSELAGFVKGDKRRFKDEFDLSLT